MGILPVTHLTTLPVRFGLGRSKPASLPDSDERAFRLFESRQTAFEDAMYRKRQQLVGALEMPLVVGEPYTIGGVRFYDPPEVQGWGQIARTIDADPVNGMLALAKALDYEPLNRYVQYFDDWDQPNRTIPNDRKLKTSLAKEPWWWLRRDFSNPGKRLREYMAFNQLSDISATAHDENTTYGSVIKDAMIMDGRVITLALGLNEKIAPDMLNLRPVFVKRFGENAVQEFEVLRAVEKLV